MTAAVVVLSTAAAPDEAERIAAALVGERLAACVNLVGPITSIYRWRGSVEHAAEVLMVIKTRRALAVRLVARLRKLHSYEVPEAIVMPIASGSAPYLRWLAAATAAAPAPRRRARTQGSRAAAPKRRPRRRAS
ncbi:MAG: hypothetical protein B6D46_07545 [Polyangiaceae bacterium UTPRO1]|nr:divalent-cation tolerance protein CutA [Myxococcales bacterium]OQY67196.1 MAG: hypothetical protein B6D46_07545 [Polyangiaceae bacterium UTPRO1]